MIPQHDDYKDNAQIDLIPGTLRGYRAWRWENWHGVLMSIGWFYLWPKVQQQPNAACLRGWGGIGTSTPNNTPQHFAPVRHCTCGYYASYDPATYETQANIEGESGYVHGAISAHGRIVLGTGGFRAQFVRVDAFWGGGINGVEASEKYEVPWFITKEDMLEAFPPSDVTELLGPNPDPDAPYLPIYWI